MGVKGDAVPAQPRPGGEFHEPEGLGGRGLDHFPHVHAQFVAYQGHLVDQANVHHSECVLHQLGHLGYLAGRNRDHRLQGLAVKRGRHLRAGWGHSAHHFRGVLRRPILPAGVYPLRGKGQENILPDLQTVVSNKLGEQQFPRCTRVGGGFQDNHRSGMDVRGQILHRADDVAQIGVFANADRVRLFR